MPQYFYFLNLNDPDSFMPVGVSVEPLDLYRVCWAGPVYEDEDDETPTFTAHYSPDIVTKEEAERRVAWGRETYPQLIYWIEKA